MSGLAISRHAVAQCKVESFSMISQATILGRLRQSCEHPYTRIRDHKLEVVGGCLVGKQPCLGCATVFQYVAIHLTQRRREPQRCFVGKSHTFRRSACCLEEGSSHQQIIVARVRDASE
jgi:hypothetical protein